MGWLCSVCEKSFSRKDGMQRHAMSKQCNAGLTPFQTVPMSSKKCQRFRFEHPFTSMAAGMTKSGKAARVLSLLHQASESVQGGCIKRPFDYLLINLKTTTQDNCPLRTNLLSSE